MPKKTFRELAAPLYEDPATRAEIKDGTRAILASARLAKVRAARGVTQTELASQLGVAQGNISRLERAEDTRLSTLGRYVGALGGRIEVRAVFDDVDPIELGFPALDVTTEAT